LYALLLENFNAILVVVVLVVSCRVLSCCRSSFSQWKRNLGPLTYRMTLHCLSWIILDYYGWRENHSLLTATLSRSGSGAAAPTGLLPPLLAPPLRGPLTPVSLVQREYHLPLLPLVLLLPVSPPASRSVCRVPPAAAASAALALVS
jgi:hypothetical protein